jgi:hypothetical protein
VTYAHPPLPPLIPSNLDLSVSRHAAYANGTSLHFPSKNDKADNQPSCVVAKKITKHLGKISLSCADRGVKTDNFSAAANNTLTQPLVIVLPLIVNNMIYHTYPSSNPNHPPLPSSASNPKGVPPAQAKTQIISVSTDRNKYSIGEFVQISGNVIDYKGKPVSNESVIIRVQRISDKDGSVPFLSDLYRWLHLIPSMVTSNTLTAI